MKSLKVRHDMPLCEILEGETRDASLFVKSLKVRHGMHLCEILESETWDALL